MLATAVGQLTDRIESHLAARLRPEYHYHSRVGLPARRRGELAESVEGARLLSE